MERRRELKGLFGLFLFFVIFAQEGRCEEFGRGGLSPTEKEFLTILLQGRTGEETLFVDKEKVLQGIKKEFKVDETDIKVILSLREAIMMNQGADIFAARSLLLQVISTYLSAKAEWGRKVDEKFFPFFKNYLSRKLHKVHWYIEETFRIGEAKRRFLVVR